MLAFVPADVPRDDWVSILMSIKSEFGEAGFDEAMHWSQSAESFKIADFQTTWRSIRAEGKTSIGTLIHTAKQNGFKFAPMTDEEKKKLADESAARRNARKKEALLEAEQLSQRHQQARRTALSMWEESTEQGESEYLKRKGITAHNVRFTPDGELIVPVYDAKGILWNTQRILKNGKKLFLKGGAKSGNMGFIPNTMISDFILVAEGYATASTLYEATNYRVAIAFDSGNISKVVANILHHRPNVQILICADDDQATQQKIGKNPGIDAAKKTAEKYGCGWVAPKFPQNRDEETDFNDLAQMDGGSLQLVKEQIETAISNQIEGIPQPLAGSLTTGGGGRPNAVSIMCLEDIVNRFTYVDEPSGEFAFDSWDKSLVRIKKVQSLLEQKMRWDDVKGHPTWMSKAVYLDEVGFDPTEKDPKIKCNLWSGWEVKPVKGKCTGLLLLLKYLCADEPNHAEIYDWILKWLAYPLQNPGAKLKSSIGMHGGQGTGKSMFFEAVCEIYGKYGIVLHQDALEDSFNSDWTSKKLFIVADEVVAKNDKYNIKNKLKGYITGSTIRVNTKMVAAHTEKNQMNMVFLSNEYNMLVIEEDDRRHCIIKTPEKLEEQVYQSIDEEIKNGGIAALYDYLLNYDLGDFNTDTKPPMTTAKQNLINVNLDSPQLFINDWQKGDTPYPFCPVLSTDLYSAYSHWCRQAGEQYKYSREKFISLIKSRQGWSVERKRYKESYLPESRSIQQRIVTPCDKSFNIAEKYEGLTIIKKKENQTLQEWYTDSVLSFRKKLHENV